MSLSGISGISPIATSGQGLSTLNPPATTSRASATSTAAATASTTQSAPAALAPSSKSSSSGGGSSSASSAAQLMADTYTDTVNGKNYSGSVQQESGGEYTASVPHLPGATASGSSAQSAENNLGTVIDELV